MTPSTHQVAGCVLAGGLGRRLGGLDKGLVDLAGQPLVAHVVARFAPQVNALAISANRNLDSYRAHATAVLPDADAEDGAGPLAGIATALAWCPAPLLAIVPCDSPFLPVHLVTTLDAARRRAGATVAVARTADGLQPMFALLAAELAVAARAALRAGERKVERWYRQQALVEVDLETERAALANLNTPQDLAAAQLRLAAA
ncbi:MAG: molybdenum cofactor guanylyltransferase MobA [Gammaproteobacteria bacterium]